MRDLVQHPFANCDRPVQYVAPSLQIPHGAFDESHLELGIFPCFHLVSRALIVLAAVGDPAILRDGPSLLLVSPEEVGDDSPIWRL